MGVCERRVSGGTEALVEDDQEKEARDTDAVTRGRKWSLCWIGGVWIGRWDWEVEEGQGSFDGWNSEVEAATAQFKGAIVVHGDQIASQWEETSADDDFSC